MGPWKKLGLLVKPRPELWWSQRHCMTPTPYRLSPKVLRIFYGTTDADTVGRVSYVDVDALDPTKILGRAREPLLEPGPTGQFDDSGLIPVSTVEHGGKLIVYYAGFHRRSDVPYTIFGGAAESDDRERFRRIPGPVLAPMQETCHFRAASFVAGENGSYRMWYLEGTGWATQPDGKRIPTYRIQHQRSSDPARWNEEGTACLVPDESRGEVGFSRPWVIREGATYRMWYAVRGRDARGIIGYHRIESATSDDGIRWARGRDAELVPSPDGWDSEMVCYPAWHGTDKHEYLFYCGNRNGETGFGIAIRSR